MNLHHALHPVHLLTLFKLAETGIESEPASGSPNFAPKWQWEENPYMPLGQCPICLKTDVVTREHVWPNWFLQRMDKEGAPPFGWSLNGQPLLDRRGAQIKGEKRQRIMMPICDQCNGTMNTRIEMPARDVVEPLALNEWQGRYNREQWRAFGLWWAKVLLLIGHEESFLENARLQKLVNLDFESKPDLRWLTSGSPVPDHVSVFAYNADFSKSATDHELVVPAHVLFDDGSTADCHTLSMATPGLGIAVVSHPGVTIEHPLVKAGLGWELLHSPPRKGDIGKLRPVPRDIVRFARGGGVPEGHLVDGSDLSRLTALFSYESDQIPSASLWARLRARLCRLEPRR